MLTWKGGGGRDGVESGLGRKGRELRGGYTMDTKYIVLSDYHCTLL